jgi:hypothetical protein
LKYINTRPLSKDGTKGKMIEVSNSKLLVHTHTYF